MGQLQVMHGEIIQENQYVKFVGDTWDSKVKNKIFRVIHRHEFLRDWPVGIISPNGTVVSGVRLDVIDNIRVNDKDISDWIEPLDDMTLIQTRIGIKESNLLLYVNFPSGHIRNGLEKGEYTSPDPLDDKDRRYLGFYDYQLIPAERVAPPIYAGLELFYYKNMVPKFTVANPTDDYDKLVMRFFINYIRLKEIPEVEWRAVEASGNYYKVESYDLLQSAR